MQKLKYTFLGSAEDCEISAITILSLPLVNRQSAIELATKNIARLIGLRHQNTIPYRGPVYLAFSLTRADARRHIYADLLLTMGCDVPISYIPHA